jgi:hypothetical protein
VTTLLRFLFLIPLGYIAAVVVAAAVIVFGVLGPYDPAIADSFILAMLWMMVSIGAAAVAPAAVIIVLSEAFAIRSVFAYLIVGGVLALLLQQFLGFHGSAELMERRNLLFPAAGFAGAFAYWLIAGRLAGLRLPQPPPVPPDTIPRPGA